MPEFHVPAAHALVAGERAPRATSGSEAEAEAAGARQLFGGGDRPISSRREPEEPKETVFLCTDTLLMLGARFTLENRDFGKGVTTEHCYPARAAARSRRDHSKPGNAARTWYVVGESGVRRE